MVSQAIERSVAAEKHSPAVAPAEIDELLGAPVVVFEAKQVRSRSFKLRRQIAAVKTRFLKVGRSQHIVDAPVPRGIDDHPHVAPEGARPDTFTNAIHPLLGHCCTLATDRRLCPRSMFTK